MWGRYILSLFIGLVTISIVTEGIEYIIVSVVMGVEPNPDDPTAYFTARNSMLVLILKHIYNFLAGALSGLLTAKIAGNKQLLMAWILIGAQTIAIIWGISNPEISKWLPLWLWITIWLSTAIGVYFGARLFVGFYKRKQTKYM